MFRFSLETALSVRKKQEKIKMKELAEKLSIEHNILNRISQIKDHVWKAEDKSNESKMSKSFTIDQLRHLSYYKDKMKVELGFCGQELIKAKKEVEEKQQALIQASKARKTIEILRDKEFKRYLAKISHDERVAMDEIAGNLFVRNKAHSVS
ncbi:MAG: flagellar export protein FliJ [Deltaproteobacteria bacterium]|nr:flagellar export protein FliJ [Deltaproteobacteria bacterium]